MKSRRFRAREGRQHLLISGLFGALVLSALPGTLRGAGQPVPTGVNALLGGSGRANQQAALSALTYEDGRSYGWDAYAAWGRELFFKGSVPNPPEGEAPSKPLSEVFVCAVCHNTGREDPVLMEQDPEARFRWLEQTGARGSLLQGATVWGVVNRTVFYGGDFAKYHHLCVPKGDQPPRLSCGPLFKLCGFGCRPMEPTSLADATQICSAYCNVGRYLELWELYALLTYFWDLEITLADLNLPAGVAERAATVLPDTGADAAQVAELRTQLNARIPRRAEFTYRGMPEVTIEASGKLPVTVFEDGTTHTGDVARGRALWPRSCGHCHDRKEKPFTAEKAKKFTEDLDKFHKMLADGTRHRRKAYMPNYTLERLSRQQSVDILAYLLNYPGE